MLENSMIYAELLSNIRQISVIAALETPCDATTKAKLSDNGQQVILQHNGETTTLNLPGQVSPDAQLQKPVLGNKELSWRLPMASAPTAADAETLQSTEAPWSAKHMREDSEFVCRGCDTVVIGRENIKTWKDLPSENWAEMMEFWHCHKPDDHEDDHNHKSNGASDHKKSGAASDPNANRGYGANTKFMAKPETAFVNTTTFLLAETNCSGLQARNSLIESSEYQAIGCKTCEEYIGRNDQAAEGIRLYKWRLKLSNISSTSIHPLASPSSSLFISAQLLSILQSQCSSRFLVSAMGWKPPLSPQLPQLSTKASSIPATQLSKVASLPTTAPYPPNKFISLWILSPGLRYSTTKCLAGEKGQPTSEPVAPSGTLAMKIFWKVVDEQAAAILHESENVEEMQLPAEAIIELSRCLQDSAALLPPSARRFQDWDVGLLRRYEER